MPLPPEDIRQLSFRRSELHRRGAIAEAIPLQVEILRLLEHRGGSVMDIANAHNYLSVLYTKSGDFSRAEVHALRALDLHEASDTPKAHGALACYSMMMASILMLLGRQPEAIPYAETALNEWSIIHSPSEVFLRARQAELAAMRAGTWKLCLDNA
jgi:hypothetical protein